MGSYISPAVQSSLLVMIYIPVYPIAMVIRASDKYGERLLGVYQPDPEVHGSAPGRSYFFAASTEPTKLRSVASISFR